ncbi:MAG: hypothetical protein [Lokiarchaeia virus VerdaV1]|uniref:Uncharacterized protein n=1 Tax=Lokiarchaeia virus VerdaV1 TaxID=3070170 RepID=A0AA35CR78_9CAUD|nr:MAG: hypothetical protein QIT41_gp17 [Lokiarchaeia virus VerdaV1]BDI54866.1 MAG: hypothetical protein [Lokiarchaeia virus VerdaV1]
MNKNKLIWINIILIAFTPFPIMGLHLISNGLISCLQHTNNIMECSFYFSGIKIDPSLFYNLVLCSLIGIYIFTLISMIIILKGER